MGDLNLQKRLQLQGEREGHGGVCSAVKLCPCWVVSPFLFYWCIFLTLWERESVYVCERESGGRRGNELKARLTLPPTTVPFLCPQPTNPQSSITRSFTISVQRNLFSFFILLIAKNKERLRVWKWREERREETGSHKIQLIQGFQGKFYKTSCRVVVWNSLPYSLTHSLPNSQPPLHSKLKTQGGFNSTNSSGFCVLFTFYI